MCVKPGTFTLLFELNIDHADLRTDGDKCAAVLALRLRGHGAGELPSGRVVLPEPAPSRQLVTEWPQVGPPPFFFQLLTKPSDHISIAASLCAG